MARTEAGATLVEAHRQGQLRIRAQALSAFRLIWPLWTGDEASFQRMLEAVLPTIRAFHSLSSGLASGFFTAYRSAEGAGGTAVPRLASELDADQVLGTLHKTGVEMTREAVLAGQSPEKAMRSALVRTSGSATRFVQDGGRHTLISSVAEDKRAIGWARVTDGDPCPFCRLLASRGAVYSDDTADFRAHDHCGCTVTAVYEGDRLPQAERFAREYDDAIRSAREAGELRRGTSNDLLNAYRRHLSSAGEPVA